MNSRAAVANERYRDWKRMMSGMIVVVEGSKRVVARA